ncbi:iron ABC transporter permease [Corynebacterium sp. 35RC1]|nr:iron ABC transporter permease [Corynebacterium sp. 35RC1]
MLRQRQETPRNLTAARNAVRLGMLGMLLIAVVFLGASLGPLGFQPGQTLSALAHTLTSTANSAAQDPAHALVTAVRLPRTLTAALVGASLAVAGAAMQSVFRNPLAEPGITGVSSGAAVVAVLAITTGLSAVHPLMLPLGAFAGALLAVVVVQAIAARGSSHTILLVGVALNAFLGAVIAAVIANAVDAEDARSAMFWLNGDLTGTTMADIKLVILPLLLGMIVVGLHARELNLLAAGEAIAHTSGMQVGRTKQIVLFAAALTTASGVAITGIIAFVGLVVPHLVRLLWGSDHRLLLPASALLGGVLLVCADVTARLVWQPVALQTGVVTALFGAPFLLFLVIRAAKQQQGGQG